MTTKPILSHVLVEGAKGAHDINARLGPFEEKNAMSVEIQKGFWSLVIEFVGGAPLPITITMNDFLTYLRVRDGRYAQSTPEFIEALLTEDGRRNLPFTVTKVPDQRLRFLA